MVIEGQDISGHRPSPRPLHPLSLKSAEHCQHRAGSNSGTDNAGNVRAHSVHEQEVTWFVLLSNNLAYTSCHWYCRYTGGTNQRVDLAAGNSIHDLAEHNASPGAADESDQAEDDDFQRLSVQEVLCRHRHASTSSQENRYDIAKGILRGIREAVRYTRLTEQVAQHQHANE